MKIVIVDDHIQVFTISGKKEYHQVMSLYDRLKYAVEKAGYRIIDKSDIPVVNEAINLSYLIRDSLMHWNYSNTEYMSGHSYGEKK